MTLDPTTTQIYTHLESLAQEVAGNLPDLYQMAQQATSKLLLSQGVHENPDGIYWHRFATAASSSRTFTGFEHQGLPIESITLIDLLMRRFRPSDQDNGDVLNMMSGFYRAGPQGRWFDERDEVRLLPDRVMDALWQVDFSATYHRALNDFWQVHSDDVQALARINCLSAGINAYEAGHLSRKQLQGVIDGLGVQQPMSLTLNDLLGERPSLGQVNVASLLIGEDTFANVLWFRLPGEQHVLYLPGRRLAFEAFDSEHALQQWFHHQLQSLATRALLLSHATLLEDQAADARLHRFQAWAGETLEHFATRVRRQPISADCCRWLRDQTRTQMTFEAHLRLRSNTDLRKQMWIGYLGAGLKIFAPMAAIALPVTLLVVVMEVAHLALNIEQAIDAPDPAERKAALAGAIVGGIGLLLNLPLLLPGVLPEVEALEEIQANVVLGSPQPLDAPLEGAQVPGAKAVFTTPEGQFIRIHDGVYRVRFDATLNTWLIVDADNPFAFYGNFPVRLTEAGEWELVEAPCLRGGGQCFGSLAGRPRPPVDYAAFEAEPGGYEVPAQAREATRELLSEQFRRLLSGDYYDPDSPLNPVLDSLFTIRAKLARDAADFIGELPPSVLRSQRPLPDSSLPAPLAFRRLLQESEGAVIGESHSAIASKRFLIENMKAMAREGVDTLYLEHLMSDLHQAELDLFARTGKMSPSLQDYLRDLDIGHHTDPLGEFNFTRLVAAAQRQGIRVQALDCAASYRVDGMQPLGDTLRQKLFSYYAFRTIQARNALPPGGKWVALMGNTHAGSYKGIPGIADLEGVTAIRIVDAGPGQGTHMTVDPGEYFLPSAGSPDGIVRGHWRLALQTREQPLTYLDPALAPPGVWRP